MNRFIVHWEARHPMQGEVYAETSEDAIVKAMNGDFIPNTIDSEPGYNHWKKSYADKIANEEKGSKP